MGDETLTLDCILHVFAYLEAPDLLKAAQVNKVLGLKASVPNPLVCKKKAPTWSRDEEEIDFKRMFLNGFFNSSLKGSFQHALWGNSERNRAFGFGWD